MVCMQIAHVVKTTVEHSLTHSTSVGWAGWYQHELVEKRQGGGRGEARIGAEGGGRGGGGG